MELADHLAAVERATGGTVCFHDYSGRLEGIAGSARIQHRNRFCIQAKRQAAAACTACDAGFCQTATQRLPDGFLKRCHAGVIEAYAPIRDADGQAGAVFIGPWRWTGRALPPEVQRDGQAAIHLRSLPQPPEVDDPQRLEDALLLARLLASHCERLLAGPPRPADAATRIRAFASVHQSTDDGLADLARHLGISPRSASRLVRSACGTTWPRLLIAARLQRAQRLLALTRLEVGEIAERCGLRDHRHLDRLFRRAHGCTPLAWRARVAETST
jgi:AraC-like DNA-binding protein